MQSLRRQEGGGVEGGAQAVVGLPGGGTEAVLASLCSERPGLCCLESPLTQSFHDEVVPLWTLWTSQVPPHDPLRLLPLLPLPPRLQHVRPPQLHLPGSQTSRL